MEDGNIINVVQTRTNFLPIIILAAVLQLVLIVLIILFTSLYSVSFQNIPPYLQIKSNNKQFTLPISPQETYVSEVGVNYLMQGTVESVTNTNIPAEGYIFKLRSPTGSTIPADFFLRADNVSSIVSMQGGQEERFEIGNIQGNFVNIYYYSKVKPGTGSGIVTKIIVGVQQ